MVYCVMIGGQTISGSCPIGGKKFMFDEGDNYDDVFQYCEKTFGFHGDVWDKTKKELDVDKLKEMLNNINVRYDEFIE